MDIEKRDANVVATPKDQAMDIDKLDANVPGEMPPETGKLGGRLLKGLALGFCVALAVAVVLVALRAADVDGFRHSEEKLYGMKEISPLDWQHFGILHSDDRPDQAPRSSTHVSGSFFLLELLFTDTGKVAKPEPTPIMTSNSTSPAVAEPLWAKESTVLKPGIMLLPSRKTEFCQSQEWLKETAIYIMDECSCALWGSILNYPTGYTMSEALTPEGKELYPSFVESQVYFGGPFMSWTVLHPYSQLSSVEIQEGVYAGACLDHAQAMVRNGTAEVDKMQFLNGYLGWERKVLEQEVAAGVWHAAEVSPELVMQHVGLQPGDKAAYYEQIMQLLGK